MPKPKYKISKKSVNDLGVMKKSLSLKRFIDHKRQSLSNLSILKETEDDIERVDDIIGQLDKCQSSRQNESKLLKKL